MDVRICAARVFGIMDEMTPREEIIPVREAHRLNREARAEYLKKELKGFSGELTVHQFGYGHSNPTFLLVAENPLSDK